VLAVIRLTGKRTIGNFTAFDLLVALMVGEMVDEAIYGDVSLAQAGVAIGVVGLAQYANSWLSYWDHGFDWVLEGRPTVVVEDGRLRRAGLRKERMSEREVMSALRHQGVDQLAEVRLATVENDGEVSVLLQDWAQPLRKADLPDRSVPAAGRRTDSKEALGG
jgi:uncharacterized membrane protein YcaP (DUF421 family)